MVRTVVGLAVAVLVAAASGGCAKKSEGPFATPEAAFDQVKKALMNMDADLMWDCLGDGWKENFEKGRQEMVAKPQQEKDDIAKEGLVTAADIDKMDAKAFFKFYFNYRKHEVFTTSAPEILEKKGEMLRDAKVSSVEYLGPDKATHAVIHFILDAKPQHVELVKAGDKWLLDVREGGGEPKTP